MTLLITFMFIFISYGSNISVHSLLMSFFTGIQALTHEEANRYMDSVLNGRFVEEAKYSRLDPYKLENITVAINHTGKQRGKAVLTKGQLFHMSKVRRAAHCSVPFMESANTTFTCYLRFDHLQANYSAEAEYDNMNVMFYPHVTVKKTNITVQITSNPEEDIPSLRLLFINHLGSINVTADMLSIGNLSQVVGPPVREALVKKASQGLHHLISGRFKDCLGYSIYKTPVGFNK